MPPSWSDRSKQPVADGRTAAVLYNGRVKRGAIIYHLPDGARQGGQDAAVGIGMQPAEAAESPPVPCDFALPAPVEAILAGRTDRALMLERL